MLGSFYARAILPRIRLSKPGRLRDSSPIRGVPSRASAGVPIWGVVMIRLCEHILYTNFAVLSFEAQRLWLYAALRSKDDGIVNIHINVMPKLAGLTDSQSERALEELSKHNFYDDDDEPFLTKWEDQHLSISKVLRWKCRRCEVEAREFIPLSIRQEVLAIGICAHCESDENLEVDHIRPISLGGSSERNNLQALCSTCNRSKRNRFIG
jgi:hypothetical protein